MSNPGRDKFFNLLHVADANAEQLANEFFIYEKMTTMSIQGALETSPCGKFAQCLERGVVERFEMVSDREDHSGHNRCFYRLIGDNTIYHEEPLSEPRFGFTARSGKIGIVGQRDIRHMLPRMFSIVAIPGRAHFQCKPQPAPALVHASNSTTTSA